MSNCINSKELTWNGSDLGNITQFLTNLISFQTSGPIRNKIRTSEKLKGSIDIIIEVVNSEKELNTILAIDSLKPYFHLIPVGYHKCNILNKLCIIYQDCDIISFDEASRFFRVYPIFEEEILKIREFSYLFGLDERYVYVRTTDDALEPLVLKHPRDVDAHGVKQASLVDAYGVKYPLATSRPYGFRGIDGVNTMFRGIRTAGSDESSSFKTNNEIMNKIESTFRKFGADLSLLSEISKRVGK